MSAVAWIVLGGVIAVVGLTYWLGYRVDRAARSIAEIANIVARVEHGSAGGVASEETENG